MHVAFHVDWFTNNIPIWKKLLKKIKDKPNLSFLEIGCFEGRATLWLIENILTHPSSKITVIDTFKGSMENKDAGHNTKNLLKDFKENLSLYISSNPKKNKIFINEGISSNVLRQIEFKNRFDCIYIDGSHIAKDVLEDAILSWKLLKEGGILIFDDYGWRVYKNPLLRPDLAINTFLLIFKGQYKILHKGYQVALLKKGDDISIPKSSKEETTEFVFIGKDKLQEFDSKINLLLENLDNNKITINNLSKDLDYTKTELKRIQSTKMYKIWLTYHKVSKFLKG